MHSVGTYPETSPYATCQGTFGQSSQLAEQLWTDPGIKSEISVRELIFSYKKKKKKTEAGNEWSKILPKSSQEEKSHHQRSVMLKLAWSGSDTC